MRTVAPPLSLPLIINSVFERSCDNASLSDFDKLSLDFTSSTHICRIKGCGGAG